MLKALLTIEVFATLFVAAFFTSPVYSKVVNGIHTAPIVMTARSIRAVQYHPINMYRVFRAEEDGTAVQIPFQIDEKDRYGDFILPDGPNPNTKFSNGIFDYLDELSIMGNDIGPRVVPNKWNFKKPSVLYEVRFNFPEKNKEGAVYIGAYFSNPPPIDPRRYVNFNLENNEILTSRYKYRFDPQNYLVVRGVDITNRAFGARRLLDSSTFYLRADLKYFLTFNINQEDITSELDAYKAGPIRTIARVNFNYTLLKLNFDLGMYTEVSFFSNSVILPALIDNPLEGAKSLNKGSLFYYGFALMDSPKRLKIESNMTKYEQKGLLSSLLGQKDKVKDQYWLTAVAPTYMFYMELQPSQQMKKVGNLPMYYAENVPASSLKGRDTDASPLGESPVNIAIAFDLQAFSAGIHEVKFRLFVENLKNTHILNDYKDLNKWIISSKRLPSNLFKKQKKKP